MRHKLIFLLVVLMSCSRQEYPRGMEVEGIKKRGKELVALKLASSSKIKTADIFFFNDDRIGLLDSYQRINVYNAGDIRAYCRSGAKRIVIVANYRHDTLWSRVYSLSGMEKVVSDIKDEIIKYPVMTGTAIIRTDKKQEYKIVLSPLLCKITIRSLKCDFRHKEYKNKSLNDVKIYLLNINENYPAFSVQVPVPSSYINMQKRDFGIMEKMQDTDLIYKEIDYPIGNKGLERPVNLYCYPNLSGKNNPLTPKTLVVIEGKIDDTVYYYPFEITFPSNSFADISNSNFIYDITITQLGATSAENPVHPVEKGLDISFENWKEEETKTIEF